MSSKAQIIHFRAFVMGRAVAYCKAGERGPQPTTSSDPEKVNCQRCKAMRAGRAS